MAGGRSASPIPFHKSLTHRSIHKKARRFQHQAGFSNTVGAFVPPEYWNLIYHFCQLDLSLFRSASDIKHIHRVSMQRDDEKYTPLSQAHASHELIAF